MKNKRVLNLIICGLFTAFLSVCSWICFPSVLPFTLQVFALFFISLTLSPKASFLTVMCYLAVGCAGLPVFAGFRGGLDVVTGPTGGFLMGFIITAPLVSFLSARFKNNRLYKYLSCSLGLLICYLFGGVWFAIISDTTLLAGFIWEAPFIPLDLIKIVMSVELNRIFCRIMQKNIA